jgi:hypothetical protein
MLITWRKGLGVNACNGSCDRRVHHYCSSAGRTVMMYFRWNIPIPYNYLDHLPLTENIRPCHNADDSSITYDRKTSNFVESEHAFCFK